MMKHDFQRLGLNIRCAHCGVNVEQVSNGILGKYCELIETPPPEYIYSLNVWFADANQPFWLFFDTQDEINKAWTAACDRKSFTDMSGCQWWFKTEKVIGMQIKKERR